MFTSSSLPPAQRVTAISVSYGSAVVLRELLQSLREVGGNELSIIVADNKADLAPVSELSEEYNARYLALPQNPGYGAAINAAVNSDTDLREWLLICNPDLKMLPGSIDALVRRGDSDRGIAIVGPQILETDGSIYPSARSIPSIRSGIGHALFANIWPSNPWSARYHDVREGSEARPVGWLSGACLLVRREYFLEIGGFDDGYFMYFEDVDLGYRMGLLGYQSVYEPAAQVIHTGAHSTQENSAEMLRAHHRSAARFLSKKYAHPLLFPLRLALRAGLSVRASFQAWRAR